MDSIRTGSDHRYAFGGFIFNPASGELREGAKATQLRPQVAKLLELLLGNPDNVVTREEIRHTLWDEKVVVEFEEGISACVRQLRVALNDGVAGVRYVQTIARRGYKFVAPVQILPAHGQVADSTTQPVALSQANEPPAARHMSHGRLALAAGIIAVLLAAVAGGYFYMFKSPVRLQPAVDGQRAVIAVLPFDNLSSNVHNSLLGASVSNDLIDLLGPIAPKRLGVIAYTSVMQFSGSRQSIREIGQRLGANYILEGSVTQSANSVQISARLIRADTQNYVWGDEFDMDLHGDSDAFQETAIRIAVQVARLLAPDASVNPRAYTHSAAAASAYQSGRLLADQGKRDQALQACVRATALDPGFAVAYVCQARLLLDNRDVTPAQVAQAGKLADRALRLDSELSGAHSVQGALEFTYKWNLAAAYEQFKAALRLNPGDVSAWRGYAGYLAATGQKRKMRNALGIMHSLDPASTGNAFDAALFNYVAGEYEAAVKQARISAGTNDTDESARHLLLLSLLGKGEYVDASRQAVIDMRLLGASDRDIRSVQAGQHVSLVNYFNWYAERLASKPADRTTAVYLADAYMHLGKNEQALEVVTGTVARHQLSILIPFLSVWPTLRPLCNEPRFIAMTNHLGQPGCTL